MAVKETNAVVAPVSGTPAKDQIVPATLIKVDDTILGNTRGTRYLKCTLKTTTGATARGVIYESVWDKVQEGDEVRIALSSMPDGTIIPSVVGLPMTKLTLADFGL